MSDLPKGFIIDKPAPPQPGQGGALPPGFVLDAPAEEGTTIGALWDGLLHGMGNIAMGSARIGARITEPGATSPDPSLAPAVDRMAQERQRRFEQQPSVRAHPTATAFGEFGGEAAMTAPLSMIPGGAAETGGLRALWSALMGAGGGAVGAASQAPSDRFGPSVLAGAGLGGATGGALGGSGAMVRPPALERPMLRPGQAPSQPGAMPQPTRPMLALPPPSTPVAGQPATPTGVGPGQFGDIATLLLGRGDDPRLRAALQRLPQPGMMPPGPGSTMRPSLGPQMGPPAPRNPQLFPGAQTPPQRPPQSWSEAARMLTSRGVNLSPMQARNMSEAERTLQTWPILRGFIRGDVGRSVDSFNRATVSQALEPIGAVVPRSVKAGHPLIEFATKQLGDAYDRVLPNLSLTRTGVARTIQSDPELSTLMSELAADDAKRLSTIIENRVLSKFDDHGVMDGSTFKGVERDLGRRADSFIGTNNDELGRALHQTLSSLRDELGRQNPPYAADLQRINQAFSMFARVRAASVRDADAKGVFTPNDLLITLRGEDPSSGNSAFARGRAPMQAFAEAGQEVIGPSLTNRVPEMSRSAARLIGDFIAGSTMTPPYLASRYAGRIPGAGRFIGGLAPGAGAEVGRRSQQDDNTGPMGARVIERQREPR